jgi:hypothetical protein
LLAVRKHQRAKMRREVPELASALPVGRRRAAGWFDGGLRGLDCVVGCVRSMVRHVSGPYGLTGGARGSARRAFVYFASCGMGGDPCGSRRTHPYLATRPCSRRLDGFPRAVVLWAQLLEERQHMLSAVRCPGREQPVVLRVNLLEALIPHQAPCSAQRWS